MYFEELRVGMSMTLPSVTMEKSTMLEFARCYADQPLHTDEAYAATTPFGQLVAPGMLSFLVVWRQYLACDWFGDALLAGKSTKVEWMKPVFAGDTLHATVSITALTERNVKNGLAEMTIRVANQQGQDVLTAVVEAVVKRQ